MQVENAMRQMTLASQASFEKYARKIRREEFLNIIDPALKGSTYAA